MKKICLILSILLIGCVPSKIGYVDDDAIYPRIYQYPYLNPPLYLNRYNQWNPYYPYYQPRIYITPLPNYGQPRININQSPQHKSGNMPIRKFK